MWNTILIMLLPYAVDAIKAYIKSSKTDSDDKVLDIVQDGCKYLSKRPNNDVKIADADILSTRKMLEFSEDDDF